MHREQKVCGRAVGCKLHAIVEVDDTVKSARTNKSRANAAETTIHTLLTGFLPIWLICDESFSDKRKL